MAPFNLLGNIIWLIFGGLFCAIGYVVGGIALCCTVIGIPFGLQCFKLAGVVLFHFGKDPTPCGRGSNKEEIEGYASPYIRLLNQQKERQSQSH
ncbi:MAG: YccF domain-containing protein [Simkania negevensis]|nr:YccF domain-containing protein [Simkania negevensis]